MEEAGIQQDVAMGAWLLYLALPSLHLVFEVAGHVCIEYTASRVESGHCHIRHRSRHKKSRYEVEMELWIFDKPQAEVGREEHLRSLVLI
jgi:hypothetical protein